MDLENESVSPVSDQDAMDEVQEIDASHTAVTRVPTPREIAYEIIRLEREFWEGEYEPGSVCFAIDGDWWRKWSAYTGFKQQPGHHPTVEVICSPGLVCGDCTCV